MTVSLFFAGYVINYNRNSPENKLFLQDTFNNQKCLANVRSGPALKQKRNEDDCLLHKMNKQLRALSQQDPLQRRSKSNKEDGFFSCSASIFVVCYEGGDGGERLPST